MVLLLKRLYKEIFYKMRRGRRELDIFRVGISVAL